MGFGGVSVKFCGFPKAGFFKNIILTALNGTTVYKNALLCSAEERMRRCYSGTEDLDFLQACPHTGVTTQRFIDPWTIITSY